MIDKNHYSRRSPYYSSVKNDKIALHQLEHANQDRLVKTLYLMMIADISEQQCVVENLWKRGRSNWRLDYANFGRRVGKNYFKAFSPDVP